MAEDVGKRLLGEVEEVGLDEILHNLRVQNRPSIRYFDFPPLDRLLQTVTESRSLPSKMGYAQPIIELLSLAPGGGKTHLLYHLCALAILPASLSGKQACVIVLDTDNRFSVSRLVTQIQLLLRQRTLSGDDQEQISKGVEAETMAALRHVHIFHPQSIASTIATLDSLQAYLFNNNRHYSFDRQVAFVAIDSGSAFYWQDRAETEDAAFLASTSAARTNPIPQQSSYVQLSKSLKTATQIFCCPALIMTWYLTNPPNSRQGPESRGYRPQLPALQPTLRLVVQRLPVRKFPPGIGVEQALREASDRQNAVDEGKFECFVNEWGVDERTLQAFQRAGAGFVFKIKGEGLVYDEVEA